MTTSRPGQRQPDPLRPDDPGAVDGLPTAGDPDGKLGRLARRRAKIREELARNDNGEFSIPTWGLVVLLFLVILGWFLLVVLTSSE